jgi:hypothetical protein
MQDDRDGVSRGQPLWRQEFQHAVLKRYAAQLYAALKDLTEQLESRHAERPRSLARARKLLKAIKHEIQ